MFEKLGFVANRRKQKEVELCWCGKLPAVGDFVWSTERTPSRMALDEWLQSGVHHLRASQGDEWQAHFDHAPVWNFLVPARVLGDGWAAGCISPSCDRVGRRFPLSVAYSFSQLTARATDCMKSETVPELLAITGNVMYQAIRRAWTREALASALENALRQWQDSMLEMPARQDRPPSAPSVILEVLTSTAPDHQYGTTQPVSRTKSFPWPDVARTLTQQSGPGFWWTNGAGGAPLKAFTYDNRLDGPLMSWLFGRRI